MRSTTPASPDAYRLGEGPVWDAARERLLWLDIVAGAVLEGRLGEDAIEVTGRLGFDGTVGAVAVADDGTLLVAAHEHLLVVRPDGAQVDGPRIVPAGHARRLNDGKPDPAGRFVVGTMSLAEPTGQEVLVRVEDDSTLAVLDDDLMLSNGLAWSTDGTLMFSVDSLRQTVFVRNYDVTTGSVGPRRVHLRLDEGLPDGIAMDADDHLWVAVWGSGQVLRHAPAGNLVETLAVPAPHTSSVAFAGDDLRTLVVTTAMQDLDDDQLREFPDSGRVFTAPVDVPGAPVAVWNGRIPTRSTPA